MLEKFRKLGLSENTLAALKHRGGTGEIRRQQDRSRRNPTNQPQGTLS